MRTSFLLIVIWNENSRYSLPLRKKEKDASEVIRFGGKMFRNIVSLILIAYLGISMSACVTAPPPDNALVYYVQEGDTLQSIAAKYGVSSEKIAESNNIGIAENIKVGQPIKIPPKIPPGATFIPSATHTLTATPTRTATFTPTFTLTFTPTRTSTPSVTPSPTLTATFTHPPTLSAQENTQVTKLILQLGSTNEESCITASQQLINFGERLSEKQVKGIVQMMKTGQAVWRKQTGRISHCTYYEYTTTQYYAASVIIQLQTLKPPEIGLFNPLFSRRSI